MLKVTAGHDPKSMIFSDMEVKVVEAVLYYFKRKQKNFFPATSRRIRTLSDKNIIRGKI